MEEKDINEQELFKRICLIAQYGRESLQLSFFDLEKMNPSFAMIAKICEMIALELSDSEHKGLEHAMSLMETLRDIAVAIANRDDAEILHSMCILDEFLGHQDIRPHIVNIND
jgi:hypothetical protein